MEANKIHQPAKQISWRRLFCFVTFLYNFSSLLSSINKRLPKFVIVYMTIRLQAKRLVGLFDFRYYG
jgi:hypothetical protein